MSERCIEVRCRIDETDNSAISYTYSYTQKGIG